VTRKRVLTGIASIAILALAGTGSGCRKGGGDYRSALQVEALWPQDKGGVLRVPVRIIQPAAIDTPMAGPAEGERLAATRYVAGILAAIADWERIGQGRIDLAPILETDTLPEEGDGTGDMKHRPRRRGEVMILRRAMIGPDGRRRGGWAGWPTPRAAAEPGALPVLEAAEIWLAPELPLEAVRSVAAHEIGHVLLGARQHDPAGGNGIMAQPTRQGARPGARDAATLWRVHGGGGGA